MMPGSLRSGWDDTTIASRMPDVVMRPEPLPGRTMAPHESCHQSFFSSLHLLRGLLSLLASLQALVCSTGSCHPSSGTHLGLARMIWALDKRLCHWKRRPHVSPKGRMPVDANGPSQIAPPGIFIKSPSQPSPWTPEQAALVLPD